MGENGQIQAVLDSYGIRYTGSGYVGSLLAMHKGLTKQMFKMNGIPTPEGICLTHEGWTGEMLESIRFPCVVKPASCGSSVGVSMIDTPEELKEALDNAKKETAFNYMRVYNDTIYEAIKNGVPLPKGHGRILDEKDILDIEKNKGWMYDLVDMPEYLADVLAIIEADKPEEGE